MEPNSVRIPRNIEEKFASSILKEIGTSPVMHLRQCASDGSPTAWLFNPKNQKGKAKGYCSPSRSHGGEVCGDTATSSAGVRGGGASLYGETADGQSGDLASRASSDGESRGSGEEIGDSQVWEACEQPATWRSDKFTFSIERVLRLLSSTMQLLVRGKLAQPETSWRQ